MQLALFVKCFAEIFLVLNFFKSVKIWKIFAKNYRKTV